MYVVRYDHRTVKTCVSRSDAAEWTYKRTPIGAYQVYDPSGGTVIGEGYDDAETAQDWPGQVQIRRLDDPTDEEVQI